MNPKLEAALHKASQLWCLPQHSHKVMDSDFAMDIAKLIVKETEEVKRKSHLETLISGHMEAMRPLLEEWSKFHV